MQDQRRVAHLLERGVERAHQIVRELVDKADRIREQAFPAGRQRHLPHDRVKRGKEPVLRQHVAAGEAVEQGRFASVGVPDQRDERDGPLHAPLAPEAALLFDLRERLLQLEDAAADAAAVDLQLLLARAAHPDAGRALAREHAPHAEQPRQAVLELRKLHLELALARLGAHGEDVEDEHGAVDDGHAERLLQIAHLHGGELVVKDDQVRLERVDVERELVRLARADVGRVVHGAPPLERPADDLHPGRFRKGGELAERIVPVRPLDAHEDRPVRPGGGHGKGADGKARVRLADGVHELLLRQMIGAHGAKEHGLPPVPLLLAQKAGAYARGAPVLRHADGRHRVEPQRGERAGVHIGEQAAAARMRMDAAHAAEPVGVAHKAQLRHGDGVVVADAHLLDAAAAADVDEDLPPDQPRIARQRGAQLVGEERILPLLHRIERFHFGKQHLAHAAGVAVDLFLHTPIPVRAAPFPRAAAYRYCTMPAIFSQFLSARAVNSA